MTTDTNRRIAEALGWTYDKRYKRRPWVPPNGGVYEGKYFHDSPPDYDEDCNAALAAAAEIMPSEDWSLHPYSCTQCQWYVTWEPGRKPRDFNADTPAAALSAMMIAVLDGETGT